MSPVAVCGLGKAGLPLAAVISQAGLDVIGVDVDQSRVDMIAKGENPIPEEEGLGDLLKDANLKVVSSYSEAADASAYIIIVPLFINEETKKPDFSIIESAASEIGKILKKGDVVVLETTVPVGTTEGMLKDILEKESGLKVGDDFYLAYSPERIMTGVSISRYKEFPKLIGGIDSASTDKAFELYSKFAKPEKVSDAKTAEFAKISEGIYRDVNIGLANELFKVAKEHDIDFWEMRKAANHEFSHIHEPGNVGGHCIPVYPWFVINDHNVPLITMARKENDRMAEYYVAEVEKLNPKKVGVVGLSYREGVKEKAYSRSIAVISLLKEKGYEVFGKDPLYSDSEVREEFGIEPIDSFSDMDAIILMNRNVEYRDELVNMKYNVIDVKNVLTEHK